MTADLATYTEILAPVDASFRRPDPVRARVKFEQPLTQYEKLHPVPIEPPPPVRKPIVPEFLQKVRKINLLPETRSPRPGGPHPGDVLYWVTCVGGVCLLLFSATR